MNSHWPVLLAILIVGAAAAFGYMTQENYQEKGKVVTPVKDLPRKYNPIPAMSAAESRAADPAVAVVQGRWIPETTPQTPRSSAAPAPAVPNTPWVAAAPAPTMAANVLPRDMADRDTILNSLRVSLTQKFGAQPIVTAVGFAVAVQGARIEVDMTPGWSISIYNDNKAQPAVQSDNFVALLNLVAANLDFDPNVPANTTADGKMTRRPISKLGKLSLLTDPAMNNSVTIKPIVKKAAAPVNPNLNTANVVPVNPAAPAAPVKPPKVTTPFPANPVKPPTNDQF